MNSKSIISLTFAVKYFNQKTPNDTLIKHFIPGNTQDKMNAFDGNKIDFFVKIYTHEKLGHVQATQTPIPEEGATLGRKLCEFTLQSELLKIITKFH